jgi:predicted alpha/beta hydrolase
MKGSALIELFDPEAMNYYAGVCGWTLARAHARSGDPVAISAYLGSSDRFDRAMTDFAVRYADQNERDYDVFVQAIRSGRLEATEGSRRNPSVRTEYAPASG